MPRQTQTRDRLVSTAAELFWSRGYAHTGVSAIMKRAKATSGSFYHFFPTKDDLLLAVIEAVRHRVDVEILAAAESSAETPAARVAALAGLYRDHTIPDALDFGLPVGALVNELGPEHREARRRVGETFESMVRRVAGWLSAESGDDSRELAETIVASLEGAAVMALATGSAGPVDGCANQLRWVLDGVGSSGELPPPPVPDESAGDWKAW